MSTDLTKGEQSRQPEMKFQSGRIRDPRLWTVLTAFAEDIQAYMSMARIDTSIESLFRQGSFRDRAKELFGEAGEPGLEGLANEVLFTHGMPGQILTVVQRALDRVGPVIGDIDARFPGRVAAMAAQDLENWRKSPEGVAATTRIRQGRETDELADRVASLLSQIAILSPRDASVAQGKLNNLAFQLNNIDLHEVADPEKHSIIIGLRAELSVIEADVAGMLNLAAPKLTWGESIEAGADHPGGLKGIIKQGWIKKYDSQGNVTGMVRSPKHDIFVGNLTEFEIEQRKVLQADQLREEIEDNQRMAAIKRDEAREETRLGMAEGRYQLELEKAAREREIADLNLETWEFNAFNDALDKTDFAVRKNEFGSPRVNEEQKLGIVRPSMLRAIGEAARLAKITDPGKIADLANLYMTGDPLRPEDIDNILEIAEVSSVTLPDQPKVIPSVASPDQGPVTGAPTQQVIRPTPAPRQPSAQRAPWQDVGDQGQVIPAPAPQAPIVPGVMGPPGVTGGLGLTPDPSFDDTAGPTTTPIDLGKSVSLLTAGVAEQRLNPDEAYRVLDSHWDFALKTLNEYGDIPDFDVSEYLTGLTTAYVNGGLTMAQVLTQLNQKQNDLRGAQVERNRQQTERRRERTNWANENQRRAEAQYSAFRGIDAEQMGQQQQLFDAFRSMDLPPWQTGAILGGADLYRDMARMTGGPYADPAPIGGPVEMIDFSPAFAAARARVAETFAPLPPLEEMN